MPTPPPQFHGQGAAGRALDKLTPAARETVGRATDILIRAYQGREWAILIRAYQGRECRTVLALFVSEPDELGFGTLADCLGLSRTELLTVHEPLLVRRGLIERTRKGRAIRSAR